MRIQVHTFLFIQWPHPISLLHFHQYNSSPLPFFYSPPLLILPCQPASTHFQLPPSFFLSLSHAAFRPPLLSAPESMSTDGLFGLAVYFEAHFGPGSFPRGLPLAFTASLAPKSFSRQPLSFPSLTSSPLPIFLFFPFPSHPPSTILRFLPPFFLLPAEPPNFPTAAFFFFATRLPISIFFSPNPPPLEMPLANFPHSPKNDAKANLGRAPFHIHPARIFVHLAQHRAFKSPTKMQLLRV